MSGTTRGTVVTVGTFDGVHRGHRLVLEKLAARAVATGRRSVLVTFDPHPLQVVNPDAAPMLLTVGTEKTDVLRALPSAPDGAHHGLDEIVVLPFTRELAAFDAARFVDEILRARFAMEELLVGYDHGFGRGRAGDTETLRALGEQRGFTVTVVPPVSGRDGTPISSTAIRRAVAGGDLARAADGLARPYAVSGVVTPGAGRGRDLGYRTLNLPIPGGRKLLPPEGVYAVRAHTVHGAFGGMMNLGPRPTFDDPDASIEAHLFDAEGDWYGTPVRLEFIGRLRDTRRFDGVDALMRQLKADEMMARVVLGRNRAGL